MRERRLRGASRIAIVLVAGAFWIAGATACGGVAEEPDVGVPDGDASETATDVTPDDARADSPADLSAEADADASAEAEVDAVDIIEVIDVPEAGDVVEVLDVPDVGDALDVPDGVECRTTEDCMSGLTCCSGRCANLYNDPKNCSGCGSACPVSAPFCAGGACTEIPCEGTDCVGEQFCCGALCCRPGQICCNVDGPGPSFGPGCYDLFCPGGCPLCG